VDESNHDGENLSHGQSLLAVSLMVLSGSPHPGAPNAVSCLFHDVSRYVTICFTICLFISPDIDGQRAPQIRH
jgi:hypothetical protein